MFAWCVTKEGIEGEECIAKSLQRWTHSGCYFQVFKKS